MASNVLAWKDALAKGYQPGLYSYSDVPLGEYNVILDFKIWAKKVMAISCFFTQIGTDKKIQLTVYCIETGIYKAENSEVNFAFCEIGRTYRINVDTNQKRKISLVSVELLTENQE